MKNETELHQLENSLLSIQERFSQSILKQIEEESIIGQIMVACVLDNAASICYKVAMNYLPEQDLENLYIDRDKFICEYNQSTHPGRSLITKDELLILDIFYHNLKITHRFIKGEPLNHKSLLN